MCETSNTGQMYKLPSSLAVKYLKEGKNIVKTSWRQDLSCFLNTGMIQTGREETYGMNTGQILETRK